MRFKPIPETTTFGIDIGKKVFHVVALNAAGGIIQRAKFSRDTLIAFFTPRRKPWSAWKPVRDRSGWRGAWL